MVRKSGLASVRQPDKVVSVGFYKSKHFKSLNNMGIDITTPDTTPSLFQFDRAIHVPQTTHSVQIYPVTSKVKRNTFPSHFSSGEWIYRDALLSGAAPRIGGI